MAPNRRCVNSVTSARDPSSGTKATICWIEARAGAARADRSARSAGGYVGMFHQSAYFDANATTSSLVPPMTIGMRDRGAGTVCAPRNAKPGRKKKSPVSRAET